MLRKKHEQIGKLPPRYSFALNPYRDTRFSKCPKCKRLTNARKFPLFVHVDGWGPLSLGKTCRYCPRCEFIIVHQDELEEQLSHFFEQHCPDLVGNDYLVLGTVRLKAWKEGLQGKECSLDQILEHVSDFKEFLKVEVDYGGWFPSASAEKDHNSANA
ncbi:MAG: hypothetical protein KAV00_10415 [Phycisphaerae bacterium]|nr:hypothetical protein [Phycisphaerae bacterium]